MLGLEREADIIKYQFRSAYRYIPHNEKVYRDGEDWFLANSNILAVADGVGSWIDP